MSMRLNSKLMIGMALLCLLWGQSAEAWHRCYFGYGYGCLTRPWCRAPIIYSAPSIYYVPTMVTGPIYAAPVCVAPYYAVPVYSVPNCNDRYCGGYLSCRAFGGARCCPSRASYYGARAYFPPVYCEPVYSTPVYSDYLEPYDWSVQPSFYGASTVRPSTGTQLSRRVTTVGFDSDGLNRWPSRTQESLVRRVDAAPISTPSTRAKALVVKSDRPRPLQPYSPVWTESAVGLIDDMVARGDWESAYQGCRRMEKINATKHYSILIRHAVFELVAIRQIVLDAESGAGLENLDRVLDLFELACAQGGTLHSESLGGKTMGAYLGASHVDADLMMESLSRRVLAQPTTSGREILLLATLLRLDGQGERADLFARESVSQSAMSDTFRWNHLLRELTGAGQIAIAR